jgi:hypothetical protein
MESDRNIEGPLLPEGERRRQIFARTQAKYANVGLHLDDPEYLLLMDRWIDGAITMPEAAARWEESKKRRKRYVILTLLTSKAYRR